MSLTNMHKKVTQIWQLQDTKSLFIFHIWNNSTSGSALDFLKTYFISVRKQGNHAGEAYKIRDLTLEQKNLVSPRWFMLKTFNCLSR